MGLIKDLKTALGKLKAVNREEAYLNEATSPVDLELRQREVDRGRFRRGNQLY